MTLSEDLLGSSPRAAKPDHAWPGAAPGGARALLAPASVFLIAFFAYPVGKILATSFSDEPPGLSLQNYTWFFDTSVNMTVLLRTFVTAAIVTVVCLVVGFPYAYLMTVVGPRWRAVLLILALVPFWTSLMTRTSHGSPCCRPTAREHITHKLRPR